MRKFYFILLFCFAVLSAYAQQAYFVDGYHGGIYGHYPLWSTQFMVDKLSLHPEWKVNLEIEPETWDTVKVKTPQAYENFRKILNSAKIEFTNPTYAQPYCYNVSGESIIRQFYYGIKKTKEHFPDIYFSTYSVEEPCFTSCLPQILKQFGFKYASLKCPDTCWGGYPAAYGGELVNWIGPDGSSLVAVPRYACEDLVENSTWQTTAWNNSTQYLEACFNAGIKHPVGMCYQDVGWKNGPWIGHGTKIRNNSKYVTWKNYFENISNMTIDDNWHFSQEDMHVNLMWGSQVLQKIAQEVRTSENGLIIAEKMAVIANLENGYKYKQADMDEAWRTLLLAQHHDSWIVPYNGLDKKGTWADAIKRWTESSDAIVDRIINESIGSFRENDALIDKNQGYIRVFNTLSTPRKEMVKLILPDEYKDSNIILQDNKGRKIDNYKEINAKKTELFFMADVPSFGYSTYKIIKDRGKKIEKKVEVKNEYIMENDIYRIVLDKENGGAIKSIKIKTAKNKEFVESKCEYAFGELRGFFYEDGKWRSSTESPVTITVLRDNDYESIIKLQGEIASHPFTQIITMRRGQDIIDFDLTINWKENVGIGEYKETSWRDNRRAYCDDRYKLSILFPVNINLPQLYKNAPFDVCKSKLSNTFFNKWSDIKHNIILNWIDVVGTSNDYGMALLTDHTTSYSFGENYPLGITVQYSGGGLWGPDYNITSPTHIRYALAFHKGDWEKANISNKSNAWEEPLMCNYYPNVALETKSLISVSDSGCNISSARLQDENIVIRLFNVSSKKEQQIKFNIPLNEISEVDLNEKIIQKKEIRNKFGKCKMLQSIPQFGLKTYMLKLKK